LTTKKEKEEEEEEGRTDFLLRSSQFLIAFFLIQTATAYAMLVSSLDSNTSL
jgi:hypothetical protein